MVKVAIGLGSNLGDRRKNIRTAWERLSDDFLMDAKLSRIRESEPWGVTDQPDFLNAVGVGMSLWKPPGIVNYLKNLERELGRVETIRFGPRFIDLDLIAYGEEIWNEGGVQVPHPRMHERDFVLIPFQELWPDWKHPVISDFHLPRTSPTR